MRSSFLLLLLTTACSPAERSSTGTVDAAPGGGDGPRVDARLADAPPAGDMVEVPAGPFMMGCDTCSADEGPLHTVTLSAYWIDRIEVTQAAYNACVVAAGCTAPAMAYSPAVTPNHPVVAVTWMQASTYCTYAGKKLPTEAQWEKAARGASDARAYPWGAAAHDCSYANVSNCGGDALPVGPAQRVAGASPYGALDMAGNVWEWTADYYAARAYDAHTAPDPTGPATGTQRVYRGGSAGNLLELATTSNRADTYSPAVGGTGLGFRCAK